MSVVKMLEKSRDWNRLSSDVALAAERTLARFGVHISEANGYWVSRRGHKMMTAADALVDALMDVIGYIE